MNHAHALVKDLPKNREHLLNMNVAATAKEITIDGCVRFYAEYEYAYFIAKEIAATTEREANKQAMYVLSNNRRLAGYEFTGVSYIEKKY